MMEAMPWFLKCGMQPVTMHIRMQSPSIVQTVRSIHLYINFTFAGVL